jgi:hypothetical protein
MTTPEFEFQPEDDKFFRDLMLKYLAEGGHTIRGLTAAAYVAQWRTLWSECKPFRDDVFVVPILMDPLLLKDEGPRTFQPRTYPKTGWMYRDGTPFQETGELDCCFMGLMDEEGTFLRTQEGRLVPALPDYNPWPTELAKKCRRVAIARRSPVDLTKFDRSAVQGYVLCLLDILGTRRMLAEQRLDEVRARYEKLTAVAVRGHVGEHTTWEGAMSTVDGGQTFSATLYHLPVEYAYFSDSILLWCPLAREYVSAFLSRCLEVFCESLALGMPLRGAITWGEAVLDREKSVFLGDPLAQAVELEKVQEWLGVMVAPPADSIAKDVFVRADLAIVCDVPTKQGPIAGAALDWPRRWRDFMKEPPETVIERMRHAAHTAKYDNTLAFVRASMRHNEELLRFMGRNDAAT